MSYHPHQGLSTLVNHHENGEDPLHSEVQPIYQTSAFSFDSSASSAAAFQDPSLQYIYTRWRNPNQEQLAGTISALESVDLLGRPGEEPASGLVFSSGMAAIVSAVLARVPAGKAVIAQASLYTASYNFLNTWTQRYGIKTYFLSDVSAEKWEEAFAAHPEAVLAYAESPANPNLHLTDLQAVAEIAHQHGAWLMVDNTFATPYCQRPLALGADVVVHSTTKFIGGHGATTGGAAVSIHHDYVSGPLFDHLKMFGGSASPFECWLTSLGLKTFEVRMERHCKNAAQVAEFLAGHPAVDRVYYPGLEGFPQHALALSQMIHPGGMVSFELKGGLSAGVKMVDRVKLCALVASLGNVDTIITHPASMTHSSLSAETRREMGIPDGLVRLSTGIENIEDILADLDQAMKA
jgi:methionine-gamma-lyase